MFLNDDDDSMITTEKSTKPKKETKPKVSKEEKEKKKKETEKEVKKKISRSFMTNIINGEGELDVQKVNELPIEEKSLKELFLYLVYEINGLKDSLSELSNKNEENSQAVNSHIEILQKLINNHIPKEQSKSSIEWKSKEEPSSSKKDQKKSVYLSILEDEEDRVKLSGAGVFDAKEIFKKISGYRWDSINKTWSIPIDGLENLIELFNKNNIIFVNEIP